MTRRMLGPYHMALARPMYKRLDDGQNHNQDIILALSENYYDEKKQALWRFFVVRGGACPYWFLGKNNSVVLDHGRYGAMPDWFLNYPLVQCIYVMQNWDDHAELYVWTPRIDMPGVYAVFESAVFSRDKAFEHGGWHYSYVVHRCWPGPNFLSLLRNTDKVLKIAG